MYILSRIIFGLTRTAINRGYTEEYDWAFPLYAGVIWGIVMYLFHHEKGVLQGSLTSSMNYLYVDSETWPKGQGLLSWLSSDLP